MSKATYGVPLISCSPVLKVLHLELMQVGNLCELEDTLRIDLLGPKVVAGSECNGSEVWAVVA